MHHGVSLLYRKFDWKIKCFSVKITVFYIAYFAFLAGLFTASVQLMQSQLPDDKPKLNTRLNIPGLNYFPKFAASDKDQKERLANNDGIAFYWKDGQKDGDDGYQFYVDQSKAILDDVTNNDSEVKVSLEVSNCRLHILELRRRHLGRVRQPTGLMGRRQAMRLLPLEPCHRLATSWSFQARGRHHLRKGRPNQANGQGCHLRSL